MAYPLQRTHKEKEVEGFSISIGATPKPAYARAPWRGRITKVGCITAGVITTSNASVTTAINGTTVTGGTVTVTVASASTGQHFSTTINDQGGGVSAGTAALGFVNEDDVISWTPANASG